MREILFRGKTIKQNNGVTTEKPIKENMWVYGNLTVGKIEGYKCDMISNKHEIYYINPETIGQFTGLTDKNGKKIFEGDIHERENHFFVVKYGKYRDCETYEDVYGWYFEYTHEKGCVGFDGTESKYVNIIGNIHDNKELLDIGE